MGSPGTINVSKLKKRGNSSKFIALENQIIVLEACKRAGCQIPATGPEDMYDGKPTLILGVIWQLIKVSQIKQKKKRKRKERKKGGKKPTFFNKFSNLIHSFIYLFIIRL